MSLAKIQERISKISEASTELMKLTQSIIKEIKSQSNYSFAKLQNEKKNYKEMLKMIKKVINRS